MCSWWWCSWSMVFCVILYARIGVRVRAPLMSFVYILQHDAYGLFMVFYAKCCSEGISSIRGKKIQLMKQSKTGLMGYFPMETQHSGLAALKKALMLRTLYLDMKHFSHPKGCSQGICHNRHSLIKEKQSKWNWVGCSAEVIDSVGWAICVDLWHFRWTWKEIFC